MLLSGNDESQVWEATEGSPFWIGMPANTASACRLDPHRFAQRRDGVELEAGENPSCSRQYKITTRPRKARICVGRNDPP